MGRTLHYEIKPKNGCFTKKELEKLYNVGKVYQNKCDWTCETIDIDPYSIYPNWDTMKHKNCTDGWAALNARWDELAKTDKHPNEISQQLVKEKIAYLHQNETHPKYGFYGFTKTGGNELNSMQVVLALLAASRVVKNAVISLHDEGKFLKCPVLMYQGKVKPDTDRIKAKLAWLLGAPMFEKGYEHYKEKFDQDAKELWLFAHPIRESGKAYPIDGEWLDIALFVRPVNVEDFENYPEYGAAQIMAGFDGEYFGLATEDSEAKSYRMIAMFQKALPKDYQIEVCPKIKT